MYAGTREGQRIPEKAAEAPVKAWVRPAGSRLIILTVQARPKVDPRSGLGLDAGSDRRSIVAPGTIAVRL